MNIISYNLNGIRSAMRKGLCDWLLQEQPDILAVQEIKATEDVVDLLALSDLGYNLHWFSANKKGYSGVAVFSKTKPSEVLYGSQQEQSDFEGRVITLRFENFTLVNAYFPSGTTGELRQTYKYQWLDEFYDFVAKLKITDPNLIVCGDYNICHRAIDIHDPISNKKSSGFLPEERAWMDKWFTEGGFIDSFRALHPDAKDKYSWWSQRAGSRDRNKGWRIDYISLSEGLRDKLSAAEILPEAKHSDHCPVKIILDL